MSKPDWVIGDHIWRSLFLSAFAVGAAMDGRPLVAIGLLAGSLAFGWFALRRHKHAMLSERERSQ